MWRTRAASSGRTWQEVRVTGRSFARDVTGLRQIAHSSHSLFPLLPLDEKLQHDCGDFGVHTLLGIAISRLDGDPLVFLDGVRKIDNIDSAEGNENDDPRLRRRASESWLMMLVQTLGVDEEEPSDSTPASPGKLPGRSKDGEDRDSGLLTPLS